MEIKNPSLSPESSRHMYRRWFVVFLGTGFSNLEFEFFIVSAALHRRLLSGLKEGCY